MSSASDRSPDLGLHSLSISGYRSFGKQPQRFSRFAKMNIVIGQNNVGKSNLLRFISEQMARLPSGNLDPTSLDVPLTAAAGTFGINVGAARPFAERVAEQLGFSPETTPYSALSRMFAAKADGQGDVWFDFDFNRRVIMRDWTPLLREIDDATLQAIVSRLMGFGGGGRTDNETATIEQLAPRLPSFNAEFIPAFRKIGAAGSESKGFGGDGIIGRLARLDRPSIAQLADRQKFDAFRDFVRAVLSNPTAEIRIPDDRDTIHVTLDGKTLTIDSLGTGIHEVIILAAAATILDGWVICIEEPELHLNPLLQKKLARYLLERTSNQYFIATHSAAVMDTRGAEVYHLAIEGGETRVGRVSSDQQRHAICADLGYHPSDLLQCNCVIWVEGPSDRIYIEWWISALDSRLVEGVHYSIMFYGGRLASHLTADDSATDAFIKLRRLNRRGAIVMDSDRSAAKASINATKKRLKDEFDVDGFSLVTAGREIENYLNPASLREALSSVHPQLEIATSLGRFDNAVTLKAKDGQSRQADKVRVANAIKAICSAPDFDRFGLRADMAKLVQFILDSNPAMET